MTVISSKGQVTIPKKYRDEIGLTPGSEVHFELKEGELVVKKEKTEIGDYRGYLGEGDTEKFMDEIRGRK